MTSSGRIVVFGATGYTGDLAARALVARGVSPVIVGRNQDRVRALAAELGGLEFELADVSDPASLSRVVEPGDVLLSTVGPFLKYGEPAVHLAATRGAHYLDSTGEGPFIRRVFEHWGPIAARNGAALLSGFGFDFVPGALAGGLALERAGTAATGVDVAYFVTDFGTSGGTRASVAGVMLEDGFAYVDGAIRTVRAGRRTEHFTVGTKELTAVSVPGAEHFGLPQSYPNLRDVDVFLGVPPAAARAMGAVTALSSPVRRVAPLKKFATATADRFIKGSTGGPTAEQRARARCTIVAKAFAASGELLTTVTLTGPDPYDYTAEILAWGAINAAHGRLQEVGALGPVSAYGLGALTEGCAESGLVEQEIGAAS